VKPYSPLLLMGLLCCQGQSTTQGNPAAQSLKKGDQLSDCADIRFLEAANICRLDLALRQSRKQNAEGAAESCAAIQNKFWNEECHFRIAEILGRRVGLATAMSHCDKSGRFSTFCYVHAAWWARDFTPVGHTSDPTSTTSIDAYIQDIKTSPGVPNSPSWSKGIQMLRASMWFSLYYGSGSADPTAALAAPEPEQVLARSAFAWEASRLIAASEGWTDLPDKVAAAWKERRPTPTGHPMKPDCWQGRVPDVIHALELDWIPRSHTAHGATRLVGTTPEEDLTIATLEAIFFDPSAPIEMWAPWLDHPSFHVQATAARLGTLAGAEDEGWRERLSRVESPDLRAQLLAARSRKPQFWKASPDRTGCR